jgi:hypothetical protein
MIPPIKRMMPAGSITNGEWMSPAPPLKPMTVYAMSMSVPRPRRKFAAVFMCSFSSVISDLIPIGMFTYLAVFRRGMTVFVHSEDSKAFIKVKLFTGKPSKWVGIAILCPCVI